MITILAASDNSNAFWQVFADWHTGIPFLIILTVLIGLILHRLFKHDMVMTFFVLAGLLFGFGLYSYLEAPYASLVAYTLGMLALLVNIYNILGKKPLVEKSGHAHKSAAKAEPVHEPKTAIVETPKQSAKPAKTAKKPAAKKTTTATKTTVRKKGSAKRQTVSSKKP